MGAFGAINALAALVLTFAVEARRDGVRPAASRVARFVVALLPAMLLAYAVMALVWPWAVVNPLNPFRAVEYFAHFFEEPWQELFGGALIAVPDMPRSYVPTLFALKLPEIFSLLGFGGMAGAFVAAARSDVPVNRRAVYLIVALAAALPLAITVALRPAMYNGIRHFVFVLPPLAVLGGLAAQWLTDAIARLACRAGVRGRDLSPRHRAARCRDDAAPSLRIHPLQFAGRRRRVGAAPLHARLLGARVQTGIAGPAGEAQRARPSPPAAAGRSRSAVRTARRRSSSDPTLKPPGTPAAPTSR